MCSHLFRIVGVAAVFEAPITAAVVTPAKGPCYDRVQKGLRGSGRGNKRPPGGGRRRGGAELQLLTNGAGYPPHDMICERGRR